MVVRRRHTSAKSFRNLVNAPCATTVITNGQTGSQATAPAVGSYRSEVLCCVMHCLVHLHLHVFANVVQPLSHTRIVADHRVPPSSSHARVFHGLDGVQSPVLCEKLQVFVDRVVVIAEIVCAQQTTCEITITTRAFVAANRAHICCGSTHRRCEIETARESTNATCKPTFQNGTGTRQTRAASVLQAWMPLEPLLASISCLHTVAAQLESTPRRQVRKGCRVAAHTARRITPRW